MMRIWVVLALVACDSGKSKPTPQVGSSAPQPPSKKPACDLDGNYRLRFHSNGVDGWWLYLAAHGGEFEIVGGIYSLLGLAPGKVPVVVTPETCTIAIAKQSDVAGDMHLTLHVANDGAVTGNVTRTDEYGAKNEPNTPVTGLHDIAPQTHPTCIHPGIYKIAADPKTKWKLIQGHPRGPLSCKDPIDVETEALVRVSLLGKELYVDEAGLGPSYTQGFSRGVVTRDGECAITLAFEKQDLHFAGAKLVFADGKITGTADTMGWDFMEDGDAGENLWKCGASHVVLTGTRIAD